MHVGESCKYIMCDCTVEQYLAADKITNIQHSCLNPFIYIAGNESVQFKKRVFCRDLDNKYNKYFSYLLNALTLIHCKQHVVVLNKFRLTQCEHMTSIANLA
jgi:hypothetical protein